MNKISYVDEGVKEVSIVGEGSSVVVVVLLVQGGCGQLGGSWASAESTTIGGVDASTVSFLCSRG